MKKVYITPTLECVETKLEGMIATSMNVNDGRTDDDFVEGTKKKDSPWETPKVWE